MEDFILERLNPLNREQEVALYNLLHPDQHTSIQYLTKEEFEERFPEEYLKYKQSCANE